MGSSVEKSVPLIKRLQMLSTFKKSLDEYNLFGDGVFNIGSFESTKLVMILTSELTLSQHFAWIESSLTSFLAVGQHDDLMFFFATSI